MPKGRRGRRQTLRKPGSQSRRNETADQQRRDARSLFERHSGFAGAHIGRRRQDAELGELRVPRVEHAVVVAVVLRGETLQVGLAIAKFQQTYDVILSPTLAKPPVKLGVLSLSPESLPAFTKEVTEFGPHTALYNVTGQPSMSVPLHWSPEGLPIGVMFSGRFGEDSMLLRLAAQLEKAKPWRERKPKI